LPDFIDAVWDPMLSQMATSIITAAQENLDNTITRFIDKVLVKRMVVRYLTHQDPLGVLSGRAKGTLFNCTKLAVRTIVLGFPLDEGPTAHPLTSLTAGQERVLQQGMTRIENSLIRTGNLRAWLQSARGQSWLSAVRSHAEWMMHYAKYCIRPADRKGTIRKLIENAKSNSKLFCWQHYLKCITHNHGVGEQVSRFAALTRVPTC
jgi:hypothetical protein